MRPTILTTFCLLLVCSAPLRAQAPAREQLDMLQPPTATPPAEGEAEKPSTEPEAELGPIILLKRAPEYQPFRVYSDSQYLYNSNVLLVPTHADDDKVFAQALGASFSPRLVKGLASTIFVRQQWIRYDRLRRFDFDAQTAGVSLQYPMRNWFILSGGFEADRYSTRRNHDEFLEDFNTSFGIRSGRYLHQRVFLYYGYQVNWLPSAPTNLSRVDNAVYAGINVALLEPLTLQLAYRLRGLTYYQDARFDYDHSLNASLIYKFNDYISTRLFVSYVNNTSDRSGFDYRGLTAGGGLGLALRF